MVRIRSSRLGAAALVAVLATALSTPVLAKHYGDWSLAVNAETGGASTELNTGFLDGCPIQSPDALRLYMASNRQGGMGGLDIWVASRESADDPWGTPMNLGAPVNSTADDFCPTPLRGKRLLFVSARPGGCGAADIYQTGKRGNGGWADPLNLGCALNSAAGEAGPSLVEDDGETLLYFSSNRPGGFAADGPTPDSDIYLSRLGEGGQFGAAELVPGVNTASDDSRPNVRKDGEEIVFDSNRPGGLGATDIYTAEFEGDSWSTPVNLGPAINTASPESRASLSWDGRQLLFGSSRPGSEPSPVDPFPPSNDIYVSTRPANGN